MKKIWQNVLIGWKPGSKKHYSMLLKKCLLLMIYFTSHFKQQAFIPSTRIELLTRCIILIPRKLFLLETSLVSGLLVILKNQRRYIESWLAKMKDSFRMTKIELLKLSSWTIISGTKFHCG